MDSTTQNSNTQRNPKDEEVDLSHIEILDTSKGDTIDFSTIHSNHIHALKCLACGFRYEGPDNNETCPRCGSENVKDA